MPPPHIKWGRRSNLSAPWCGWCWRRGWMGTLRRAIACIVASKQIYVRTDALICASSRAVTCKQTVGSLCPTPHASTLASCVERRGARTRKGGALYSQGSTTIIAASVFDSNQVVRRRHARYLLGHQAARAQHARGKRDAATALSAQRSSLFPGVCFSSMQLTIAAPAPTLSMGGSSLTTSCSPDTIIPLHSTRSEPGECLTRVVLSPPAFSSSPHVSTSLPALAPYDAQPRSLVLSPRTPPPCLVASIMG